MRRFHLARAAILARVVGFGKNVVPLLRLWTWSGFLGIRTRFMDYGLENRSLRCFREFGDGCFHKSRLPLVDWGFGVVGRKSKKVLHGLAAETRAVVRFEPVERGVRFRIQSELVTVLNEVSALFWIFHRAAGFYFIRPGFDFSRRSLRAVRLQPGADVFII